MFLVEQIADTKPLRPGCFPCVWGAEEASVERLKLVSKEDGRKGRQDQIDHPKLQGKLGTIVFCLGISSP